MVLHQAEVMIILLIRHIHHITRLVGITFPLYHVALALFLKFLLFFFYKASGSDYKDYDSTGVGGGGSGYGNDYGSVTHFGDNEAHLSSWGLGSNIHEAGVLDAKNQPIYVSFILSLSLSHFIKQKTKKF